MAYSFYLLVVGLSLVLQFSACLISLYALRLSDLRLVWVLLAIAMLLMAVRQAIHLTGAWAEPAVYNGQLVMALLELSVAILLVVGLGLRIPALNTLSDRLALAEANQKALVESEEKYRELIDSTGAGYAILDAMANVIECNDTYVKLIGRSSHEEVVGHNLAEWVDETDTGDFIVNEMSQHSGFELRRYDSINFFRPDGSLTPVEIYSRGRQTEDGLRVVGLVRDVSAREEDRKKLEASEGRASLLFDNSPISTAIYAPNGQLIQANKAHDKLWGVVLGDADPNFNILNEPQTNALIGKDKLGAIFKGQNIALEPFVYKVSELIGSSGKVILEGHEKTVLPMFFPLKDSEGELESIVEMHIDLTERVEAERTLSEREALYKALIDSTNDGYAVLAPDETVIDANAEYVRLTGHSDLSEIKGQISRQWVSGDMGLVELHQLLETGGSASGVRCDYRHPDGTIIPAEVSASVVNSVAGQQVVLLARDISERLESEGRLRQAQKMDAIGKLTGGVAHDFNNLLAVILGNTELALAKKTEPEAISRYLQTILDAAERGADLTHRLLAFSRQTPLAPKVVDINDALENACALLQRLIGEDVDLVLVKAPVITNCEVDPSELENVIINLANNARDAMPSGGKLTIESNSTTCDSHHKLVRSGEVTVGDYVVVSVTDSGTGIAPSILHRVTDPFFTTKDVGKGTGLGLSMAYGFAKQSNGHLTIYSELGEGTIVNILIPAHANVADIKISRGSEAAAKGNEKILLVEDDPALATLVCNILEALGYCVEMADNVEKGIELYRQHADFDLLLTDMILPGGRNGSELAEELKALNPELKIMYMSGYTENAVLHHGRLDEGVVLLQKPFRTADLSATIREVLDS
ncbi:MAG: PAS domain S-box protein [Gammaproteobacteria bacterium]|nr:PAS domain S-box protein [Gammaproteobacteria bacterium]